MPERCRGRAPSAARYAPCRDEGADGAAIARSTTPGSCPTDSAIETENLVVLEDTKNLFLAQNILPLITKAKVNGTVEDALNKVSEALTTEDLTKYLAKVQVDKQDPATVAKEYLSDKKLV